MSSRCSDISFIVKHSPKQLTQKLLPASYCAPTPGRAASQTPQSNKPTMKLRCIFQHIPKRLGRPDFSGRWKPLSEFWGGPLLPFQKFLLFKRLSPWMRQSVSQSQPPIDRTSVVRRPTPKRCRPVPDGN